jgi:hypothetical protein
MMFITETNRIYVVLFGPQNRTLGRLFHSHSQDPVPSDVYFCAFKALPCLVFDACHMTAQDKKRKPTQKKTSSAMLLIGRTATCCPNPICKAYSWPQGLKPWPKSKPSP